MTYVKNKRRWQSRYSTGWAALAMDHHTICRTSHCPDYQYRRPNLRNWWRLGRRGCWRRAAARTRLQGWRHLWGADFLLQDGGGPATAKQ